MPILNNIVWKIIATIIEIQSIIFNPSKKVKKISWSSKVLSIEKIDILMRYTSNFDKKYVWIPKRKIPTKLLNNPKNFAPLKPKEDLNRTAKGKPNFWEGLPIRLQKI